VGGGAGVFCAVALELAAGAATASAMASKNESARVNPIEEPIVTPPAREIELAQGIFYDACGEPG
jgi:hypothetical protein